jgi:hypothetical protein
MCPSKLKGGGFLLVLGFLGSCGVDEVRIKTNNTSGTNTGSGGIVIQGSGSSLLAAVSEEAVAAAVWIVLATPPARRGSPDLLVLGRDGWTALKQERVGIFTAIGRHCHGPPLPVQCARAMIHRGPPENPPEIPGPVLCLDLNGDPEAVVFAHVVDAGSGVVLPVMH